MIAHSYHPTLPAPESSRTAVDSGICPTSPANDGDAAAFRALGTIGCVSYEHWIRREEARAYYGRRAVEIRKEITGT